MEQTDIRASVVLTNHAIERMNQRRISVQDVWTVVAFGRVVYTRGAILFALGRKEVRRAAQRTGYDISACEGIQVVCATTGVVVTVYRNKDFRGLKPRRRQRGSQ